MLRKNKKRYMIEDILEEATPKLIKKVKTEPKTKLEISSDKELLEEFINNMNLESNNLIDIESIDPEIKLDKYLWIIRQKEIELNKCKAIAEVSLNRTQNWLEKKEQSINSTIEFLTNQMQNYLNQNSLNKLSLPNGSIGFRKQPDSIEITDEELFLTTAASELLRHLPEKFEADLKSIKEYIKTTSEIPAGVELKSKDPKFYYKLSEV